MITLSGNAATTSPTPPPTPFAAAAPASDAKTLNANFDQFLTLLTTQLKNQDPLSPMDSTQFTNQLVSFSGVEQQIKMNGNLTKLLAASGASQTTLALSYIGLNIPMTGSTFDYPGGGSVATTYDLPVSASNNTLRILDQNGNTVYSQTGELSGGAHTFVWDGADQNGQIVAPGTYTLRVDAQDQNHGGISATTTVPGRVTGVETAADGTIDLIIGGTSPKKVPLSGVTRASL